MHCDPTLTAAQIHHKCLRAKGDTNTLAFSHVQRFKSHTENLRFFPILSVLEIMCALECLFECDAITLIFVRVYGG